MPLKTAILCDFAEEHWPSMDLAGEMIARHLGDSGNLAAQKIVPSFHRPFGSLRSQKGGAPERNAYRLFNRLWVYPRYAEKIAARFDLFHIVDHSYSQLLHRLPPDRSGVFCHDLDTFRCLLDPTAEPRPMWFRAMARHILKGMQKAAIVFYSTSQVRRQIENHGLIDPGRLVQAPLGICEEFTPTPMQNEPPIKLINGDDPFILHVGSCILRKRIDVLLEIFAASRTAWPRLKLIQIGGEWTPPQRDQIRRLGIEEVVVQQRGLSRTHLASMYRRAAIVLQPSDAEGFGLPVAEALACGAVVIASDIPVLREVGGSAALYRRTEDIAGWTDLVRSVLNGHAALPPASERLAWASRYSWAAHGQAIAQAYLRLSRGERVAPAPHFQAV